MKFIFRRIFGHTIPLSFVFPGFTVFFSLIILLCENEDIDFNLLYVNYPQINRYTKNTLKNTETAEGEIKWRILPCI